MTKTNIFVIKDNAAALLSVISLTKEQDYESITEKTSSKSLSSNCSVQKGYGHAKGARRAFLLKLL